MSNLDRAPGLTECGGLVDVAPRPVHQVYPGREVTLVAGTSVRRLLPTLGRRLVGPWCFADHYGPEDVTNSSGMAVPPHPHMGLQTVSWLLAGAVHHRDSLGNDAMVRPGDLGLMTSGAAIAHAEHSPVPHPALLHGVRLWIALPGEQRMTAPDWQHETSLPVMTDRGLRATVIMGELAGARSPGTAYSPLVGVDLAIAAGAEVLVPLDPEFEHAALVMSGKVDIDGAELAPGAMLYLGSARRDLRLRVEESTDDARVLLLGGAPFEESIVMWWNFVGRTNDEIVQARADWADGARFGTVQGAGEPLAAPPLPPGRLRPRGRER